MKEWAGTTYGNARMHRALITLLRYVDVRVLYVFSAILIIPPCLLLNTNGSRRVIYRYFRQRHNYSRIKAAWKTYINHCLFAQAVVDKFAMYAGRRFKTIVEGYDRYLNLEGQEAGFIQLSAHIGNYEIAGYTLTAHHKSMSALVFGGEKATVMTERDKLLSKDNIHLIPVREDMSHVFRINDALANNEIVSMPADRLFGSPKYVEADFLGGQVKLPLGAFQAATMRQFDVLAVNVMKTAATTYTIYVTALEYDKQAERRERTRQLATSYANELERMVRMYPCQWYNFFEFWSQ